MLEFKFEALDVDPPGFEGPLFGLSAVKTTGSFAAEALCIQWPHVKAFFRETTKKPFV